MSSLPVMGFAAVTSLGSLATLGIFLGSSLYDIRGIQKFKTLRKNPNSKQYRRRPVISVAVVVNNDEHTVVNCLKSITSSNYKKCQIIVIDNASNDASVERVKGFVARYPKKNIKLIVKRKLATTKAMNSVIQRASNGEFVVVIGAGVELTHRDTLKNVLNHFLIDEELIALNGRSAWEQNYKIFQHAKQLVNIIRARMNKSKSILGLFPNDDSVMAYRRSAYAHVGKGHSTYASDVMVRSSSKQKSGHQSWYQISVRGILWLSWLMLAVGMGYIWYLAINLKVVQPLGILWLSVSTAGLLFVMGDDYYSKKDKLRLISLLPVWYIFSCLFLLKRALSPLGFFARIRIRISLAT